MSEFKIIACLDKELFDKEINKKVNYYSRGEKYYYDDISFYKNVVTVTGKRSKEIERCDILETKNSTYYADLIKALIFVYFEKEAFTVQSIEVYIDGESVQEYTEENEDKEKVLIQVFNKKKPDGFKCNCDKLFEEKEISEIAMPALMNLTMSFNKPKMKFDYTWKCFDELISFIFGEKETKNNLCKLKCDLEENPDCYQKVRTFAKDVDCAYLKKFSTQSIYYNVLCDNEKKINQHNKFEDKRIIEIFGDEVDGSPKKKKKDNKDTDIIRLLILKYANYLRGKYFHGEKAPSYFLLDNKNQWELDLLSEPLSLLCVDLLENKLEQKRTK